MGAHYRHLIQQTSHRPNQNWSPKGRTGLIIGGSGAKNCSEHHGNVRFGVAPQKPTKNYKKPILKPIFLAIVHFWSGEQKSRFFFSASHGGVAASASGGRGAAAAVAGVGKFRIPLLRWSVTALRIRGRTWTDADGLTGTRQPEIWSYRGENKSTDKATQV